ncbi:hypothetical protein EDD18DRAFT_1464628 [Armillaria luteobubalina]|uniref:Transmembrane protein n=1 Tax=Armillaria luteobubalina TaxID=153913 RepID=A0AA39Q127_9AGAR|nr:hypothetical protein EDD18DRAFT_1464628 [Armillaria luteobubalina]
MWISLVLKLPPHISPEESDEEFLMEEEQKFSSRTIMLFAEIISADILHATAIVEWWVVDDTCTGSGPLGMSNCTSVNIFLDTDLSPSDPRYNDGPISNNITTNPILIWNGNYGPTSHSVCTDLVIFTMDGSYLSAYPFDIYSADISMFAQDVSTNMSVNLTLIEFSGLIIGITTQTKIQQGTLFKELIVYLQRSTLVIVYCVIITVTFWMVTLMICLIMIATVFFRFRQWNEIVVVPIGTVFAFTQLRASMPGAPEGFGDTLDYVGLLPCLTLLSISAITMVGVYLFADPDDATCRAFTWTELNHELSSLLKHLWKSVKEWLQRAQFRIMIARQIRRAPYNYEIPLMDITQNSTT